MIPHHLKFRTMTKVQNNLIAVQEYDFNAASKTVTIWYTYGYMVRSTVVSALDFHYFLWFQGVNIARTSGIAEYFNNAPSRDMVAADLAAFLERRAAESVMPAKMQREKRHAAPLWMAHEEQMFYLRGLI